jgi:small-conductance mechanosensitive channel
MQPIRSPFITAVAIALATSLAYARPVNGQEKTPEQTDAGDVAAAGEPAEAPPAPPAKVNVQEVVEDEDIETRLLRILRATEWFEAPSIRVDEGVVFLGGTTNAQQNREWAARLASNTEDVVAVVNMIEVTDPPVWNMQPAITATKDLGRNAVQALPMLAIATVIGLLTWLATKLTSFVSDKTILGRINSSLLREVARKAILVPVWLVGIYLMLRISGLTQLAMTVVGGTGVLGIIAGFAFRDIAENFLASILLSVQNPFRYGDLIEVDGQLGFVQRVNTRGTLLMTFDGNHIQIPNSTIYKNTIMNFSSNPNRRFDFVVGIGYDVSVSDAQEAAFEVLSKHPAVLDDPEPQVLVEALGSSTVNLRVFAWLDANAHSWMKVKSSVIRLVKRRFEEEGYSMPDDAREIVFPDGVPVQVKKALTGANTDGGSSTAQAASSKPVRDETVSNSAEGGFGSEQRDLEEQARRSRDPDEGGADLLDAKAQEQTTESATVG